MVFCPACQQVRIVNHPEILAMMWGLSLMDFVFLFCIVLCCIVFVSHVYVLSVSFVLWVNVVCTLPWSLLHLTYMYTFLYCIDTIFP